MILSLGHSHTITAITIKTGLGALLVATLLSTSMSVVFVRWNRNRTSAERVSDLLCIGDLVHAS